MLHAQWQNAGVRSEAAQRTHHGIVVPLSAGCPGTPSPACQGRIGSMLKASRSHALQQPRTMHAGHRRTCAAREWHLAAHNHWHICVPKVSRDLPVGPVTARPKKGSGWQMTDSPVSVKATTPTAGAQRHISQPPLPALNAGLCSAANDTLVSQNRTYHICNMEHGDCCRKGAAMQDMHTCAIGD